MDNFAFIIHPVNPKRDVQRKFPLLAKILSEPAIHYFSQYFPPVYISHITGIVSEATGKEIEGWFVACPLTPKQMTSLPAKVVYKKIIATGKLAQKLGAKILGLGGFTSVVGDGGRTIAKHLDIPVTTGDSYTVATAVAGALKAAEQMSIDPGQSTAAIVGATGAIGQACAQFLAPHVSKLLLVARRVESLNKLQTFVKSQNRDLEIVVSTDLQDLREADLVLTVTNAIDTIIEPYHLKRGSVVCDVARPRDVSHRVIAQRDDILVIEGGVIKVPGPVNFNFNFGLPPSMAFACMAETIALALEGRYENFSLGKNVTLDQVKFIDALAAHHGFELNGFRSFELAVSNEHINQIKQNAHQEQSQFLFRGLHY